MLTYRDCNLEPQMDEVFAVAFNERRHEVCGLLGRRWMPHIALVLSRGPRRHGELLRQVPGITQRVMGDRLSELLEAALAEQSVGEDGTSRYRLTEAGHRVFDPMAEALIQATEPDQVELIR